MMNPASRPSRIARAAAVLAVVAGLLAPPAFAARVCVDSYAGGCVSGTTCWHFDHDGNWAGTVRIDYEC